MDYKISDDEEYFLSQVILRLESNQSIAEVPQVWRPDHFDANRFHAAYCKFCMAVCPAFKFPHADYYQSIKFTEIQAASIDAWILWFNNHSKPKAEKQVSIKSDRDAQNKYNDAVKKKLEEFKLDKRRKDQEKEVSMAPTEDNWGRAKRPKIDDDGNGWREQN